jgi:hypothetical protein
MSNPRTFQGNSMFRRFIVFGALIYAVVHFSKSQAKRTISQPDATAQWESEGGRPASEPAH